VWGFRPGWRSYFGIAALAVSSHVALDLITSFGTMIFAPVSDARYALGTTFIIDLWFTGIILAGLAASAVWRRARTPAACALAALAAYVGFQYALQQRAVEFGREYARANRIDAEVSAVPRPVSPFNWTVVVRNAGHYRYAHVNLVRGRVLPEPGREGGLIAHLDAPYRPLRDARWIETSIYAASGGDSALVREAYARPDFAFFRWFATYPALLGVEHARDGRCAWFHELRFVTPGREPTPLRYGMCADANGAWAPFQLTPAGRRPVY
jgi:inner membrane protein